MSKLHRPAGFTIVELLVTLLVTGMVVTIIMNFMANGLIQSTLQTARAEILHEAQLTLDLAADDIRLSAAADQNNRWPDDFAPNAPSNRFSWTSGSDRLILATTAENGAGDILFEDTHKYITHKNNYIYFVKDRILYKRVLAAPVSGNRSVTSCPNASANAGCPADKELLKNVESFSVRYLDGEDVEVVPTDARSIELDVVLKARKYGQDITASYETRTVFRND